MLFAYLMTSYPPTSISSRSLTVMRFYCHNCHTSNTQFTYSTITTYAYHKSACHQRSFPSLIRTRSHGEMWKALPGWTKTMTSNGGDSTTTMVIALLERTDSTPVSASTATSRPGYVTSTEETPMFSGSYKSASWCANALPQRATRPKCTAF